LLHHLCDIDIISNSFWKKFSFSFSDLFVLIINHTYKNVSFSQIIIISSGYGFWNFTQRPLQMSRSSVLGKLCLVSSEIYIWKVYINRIVILVRSRP
jgi:hypothetical protein